MEVQPLKKGINLFLIIFILVNLLITDTVQAQKQELFYIIDQQNNIVLATQQKISKGDRYWTGDTWYEVKQVKGNIGYAITIEDPNISAQKRKSALSWLILLLVVFIAGFLYFRKRREFNFGKR
jgi:hypothetical protein